MPSNVMKIIISSCKTGCDAACDVAVGKLACTTDQIRSDNHPPLEENPDNHEDRPEN